MITINNLDFSYKNVAVFRNISLEFKEGSDHFVKTYERIAIASKWNC